MQMLSKTTKHKKSNRRFKNREYSPYAGSPGFLQPKNNVGYAYHIHIPVALDGIFSFSCLPTIALMKQICTTNTNSLQHYTLPMALTRVDRTRCSENLTLRVTISILPTDFVHSYQTPPTYRYESPGQYALFSLAAV